MRLLSLRWEIRNIAHDNWAIGKSIITSEISVWKYTSSLVKLEKTACGDLSIPLTWLHLTLMVSDERESKPESGPAFEKSEQACISLQKCQQEETQRQAKAGERQTNNKQKSLQEAKSSGCAEAGQGGSSCGTSEINRGYLDLCSGCQGVVDLKWTVVRRGGHIGPLAIHHSSVFDSPNACSWAASSIIHGYSWPGRSRAFYFSRVNNWCPFTQPRESRNRSKDKQGSRWLVEPVRTSTLFLFGSQRGSLHACGPVASHRGPGSACVSGALCTQASCTVSITLSNKRKKGRFLFEKIDAGSFEMTLNPIYWLKYQTKYNFCRWRIRNVLIAE